MALYKAYAICNNEGKIFQFWSKAQAYSSQNTIDACDAYYKAHEGYKGTIQITKVTKIPYKEMNNQNGIGYDEVYKDE